ncbi:MAG: hypothetical protein G01um101456_411 [Parcubacteria group bacterium Gr01-1014_56]|nr:MAG: hypothetical protein G01um101456_411 [Parcubacteria group bacterium Gr01-1014_56]
MNTQKIKNTERILKALANQRRLMIVKYLHTSRESMVGAISENIKLSFKATSKHLGVLAAADIVEREQRGLTMNYRLVQPPHPLVKTALGVL